LPAHYTRCLAGQLRSYDITVNCIAPGDTRTGRFMGTRAVDQERMAETGTLDRIATMDEVARVVEVFAGPLGAFVAGQVLRVDWIGRTHRGRAQAGYQSHRRPFQKGTGCCKLNM
jgi:3-oxoacyl-[acyl-carrier protein] reductase